MMKRKLIAAVVLGLAAVVLAGASIAGAAEEPPESTTGGSGLVEPLSPEGCEANRICKYFKANYEEKALFNDVCETAHTTTGGPWHSATNRCGNKSDWLRTNGTVVACMNPGGNRPNPGTFNEIFVPVEFGAFC